MRGAFGVRREGEMKELGKWIRGGSCVRYSVFSCEGESCSLVLFSHRTSRFMLACFNIFRLACFPTCTECQRDLLNCKIALFYPILFCTIGIFT